MHRNYYAERLVISEIDQTGTIDILAIRVFPLNIMDM